VITKSSVAELVLVQHELMLVLDNVFCECRLWRLQLAGPSPPYRHFIRPISSEDEPHGKTVVIGGSVGIFCRRHADPNRPPNDDDDDEDDDDDDEERTKVAPRTGSGNGTGTGHGNGNGLLHDADSPSGCAESGGGAGCSQKVLATQGRRPVWQSHRNGCFLLFGELYLQLKGL